MSDVKKNVEVMAGSRLSSSFPQKRQNFSFMLRQFTLLTKSIEHCLQILHCCKIELPETYSIAISQHAQRLLCIV